MTCSYYYSNTLELIATGTVQEMRNNVSSSGKTKIKHTKHTIVTIGIKYFW